MRYQNCTFEDMVALGMNDTWGLFFGFEVVKEEGGICGFLKEGI